MGLLSRATRPSSYFNPNRQHASTRKSLTASGERVTPRSGDDLRRLVQPWQTRSFGYYDRLGEIKYASQFYARGLSPLRLFAAELDDNGDIVETENEDAIVALERIQDPGGGRTGLLSAYGRLMFLTGETYLLCSEDPDTQREQWEMLSTDELRIQGGQMVRYMAPSLAAQELREPSDDDWAPVEGDNAVAYRLWQRHPRYSALADSTMQGVLDLCEELVLLTRAVRARTRSRIAGAGLLLIDDAFTPTPLEPVGDEDPDQDPFLTDLIDAMTAPIADEGTASAVVPLTVRIPVPENKKVGDMMEHLQLTDPTQLYPETGLRRECIDRIAIGLDMPPEILLGLADANHWCVDDQTEILTADGWKHYGEFGEGDEVLTLNHETGMSEWQCVQDVASFEVEDLTMVSVESRFHSSLTTMNHRWPVLHMTGRSAKWERAWTHSDELRTTHRIVAAAPSRDALWPQWVRHDDAFVELVAWLWTEGQIRERPGRDAPQVAIYQSHKANPDNVLRIRAALTSLYGAAVAAPMSGGRGSAIEQTPRWREVTGREQTTFKLNAAAAERLLDYVSADRIVSTDFIRTMTSSQLALFIDVSTRADGSTMRSGCQIIGQKDAERLYPLELAAILLGRSPVSYSQKHDGFTVHEQHYVSVSDRQTVRLKKAHIRQERYTGTIWCPVTENSTWCARRNGKVYFTGNTGWQIDEQTWKGHLQPKAQQLVDDLTAAYYRPTLKAAGVPNWDRFLIAYDASAIINHPDRTKDAKELYDRRAIGKAALRDAAGFAEDDAMPQDELAESIGVSVRDGSLALYGIPTVRGGQIEPIPGDVVDASSPAPGGVNGVQSADVEKGPPSADSAESEAAKPPSVVGAGVREARLMGAADLAVLRARESAGNRVLSMLGRRKSDHADVLKGVRTGDVPAALGLSVVRAIPSIPTERELAAGARLIVLDCFELFGVHDEAIANRMADYIEEHVARNLYTKPMPSLPPTFGVWVEALISGNGNGKALTRA